MDANIRAAASWQTMSNEVLGIIIGKLDFLTCTNLMMVAKREAEIVRTLRSQRLATVCLEYNKYDKSFNVDVTFQKSSLLWKEEEPELITVISPISDDKCLVSRMKQFTRFGVNLSPYTFFVRSRKESASSFAFRFVERLLKDPMTRRIHLQIKLENCIEHPWKLNVKNANVEEITMINCQESTTMKSITDNPNLKYNKFSFFMQDRAVLSGLDDYLKEALEKRKIELAQNEGVARIVRLDKSNRCWRLGPVFETAFDVYDSPDPVPTVLTFQ